MTDPLAPGHRPLDEPFRQRLQRAPALLGMFSIVASVEVVEMIGLAGFDFVILDFNFIFTP